METARSGKPLMPDPAYFNDTTASSGTSLLVALQKTYKDRWAILLDSIFSNETAERIMLLNSFIKAKVGIRSQREHHSFTTVPIIILVEF